MLSKVTMNFGKCVSCLIDCKGFQLVISFFFLFGYLSLAFLKNFLSSAEYKLFSITFIGQMANVPTVKFLCQAGLWSLILNPFACPLHSLSGKKTALEPSVSSASILPSLVLFH